ncbi:MAG: VOC family protein [Pelolinea sp.]|nr:VOC family protein [Pelolinea sp.]
MQKNLVVFWELATHDMEKTTAFFMAVFDWKIEFNERLGFYIIPETTPANESIEGAIFSLKRAKMPFLTIYIQVDDIFAKAGLIEEQGGSIVEAPFEIPGGSKICLFNEPSGVTFAMVEPKSKQPLE